jgi:[ribosomal protein S5]-alanine N-acetyltransferase
MTSAADLSLTGEHLLLRPLTPEDADGSYHRWMNDPQITCHLESRFSSHSVEAIREYVSGIAADSRYLFLAICLRESGRHIGNIKLGPVVQPHNHGDIGIIIGEQDCWSKGYATEAVSLLVKHAFEVMGLHKLTAGCYSTNMGSARAFEKAGFAIEAVRPSHYWQNGIYVDAVLMGMVNPQHLSAA